MYSADNVIILEEEEKIKFIDSATINTQQIFFFCMATKKPTKYRQHKEKQKQ